MGIEAARLFAPVDRASLVAWRVMFGLLMAFAILFTSNALLIE